MITKYIMLAICFACTTIIGISQPKTDTIKVWGKCEMCKAKIEKAARAAGANSAEWNEKNKLLVVSYDLSQTSNIEIQKRIAGEGYDAQDIKASKEAYNKLEKCCQYKRPATGAMDTTGIKETNGMRCMGTGDKKNTCMNECGNNVRNCTTCKTDCYSASADGCSNGTASPDKSSAGNTVFGKGYYSRFLVQDQPSYGSGFRN